MALNLSRELCFREGLLSWLGRWLRVKQMLWSLGIAVCSSDSSQVEGELFGQSSQISKLQLQWRDHVSENKVRWGRRDVSVLLRAVICALPSLPPFLPLLTTLSHNNNDNNNKLKMFITYMYLCVQGCSCATVCMEVNRQLVRVGSPSVMRSLRIKLWWSG